MWSLTLSENNVLAQGILFESEEGSKCDSKNYSAVAPATINFMRPCSMVHHIFLCLNFFISFDRY